MKNKDISKSTIVTASRKGIARAAADTRRVMGYNVIKKDGWIVKAHNDGRVEKIKRIK